MLIDSRLQSKFERLGDLYDTHRFEILLRPAVEFAETMDHRRRPPVDLRFRPCPPGTRWGRQWGTAWFRSRFVLPPACRNRRVLVRLAGAEGANPFGGKEYFVFLDGQPRSILSGMHTEAMIAPRGRPGRSVAIDIEAYAGHHMPGCTTLESGLRPPRSEDRSDKDFQTAFGHLEVVVENTAVADFVDDLRALIGTAKWMDANTLRRNEILAGVRRAFECLESDPDWADGIELARRIAQAQRHLRPLLARRNGPTTPTVGIVGHAHIDTAWLWTLAESIRKCGRTFSTQLTLAEEFPELTFHQSQSIHAEWVKRHYPTLFRKMQAAFRKGQWEPGGAMWVEADCNVMGGEAMIRQILEGKRSTRQNFFGYESDELWLPDVFGYSAAMPQILKGCGVDYFVTSKINWNDTNRFPYDTFVWQGIDGSRLLTHYITSRGEGYNARVTPERMLECWNQVQHKEAQDRVLLAVGYGDGGGGLTEAHCRMARRLRDLEGIPKVEWINVSRFLRAVAARWDELPTWVGELYLELHRGTYTSQARIKRGNRLSELRLRDAEFVNAMAWLRGKPYPAARLRELWRDALTLQFHDVLPGSSIRRVNVETEQRHREILGELDGMTAAAVPRAFGGLDARAAGAPALLVNTLSWERRDPVRLPAASAVRVTDARGVEIPSQCVKSAGRWSVTVAQAGVPSMGAKVVYLHPKDGRRAPSAFRESAAGLDTPFYRVRFDRAGRIVSLVDKAAGREIVAPREALNTFLFGEDLPASWDNWDVDADIRLALKPGGRLVRRATAGSGAVEHRIRTVYDFGAQTGRELRSTLSQDVVFYAHDRRIDFETRVDWHHSHRLLKAAFPFALRADQARFEIQYGHLERATHENTSWNRAMFEVCAHKWVDVSENDYGVALLNDCKYGYGARGATIDITLVKSGCHPDEGADQGEHRFTYSLRPHAGAFCVREVVRPAYELNTPVMTARPPTRRGPVSESAGFTVDGCSAIIEAVKKAEEGDALVVRLYDAEKIRRRVTVSAPFSVRRVVECTMLERPKRPLKVTRNRWSFPLAPFEIKTFKVYP